jgi:hypothetical protein
LAFVSFNVCFRCCKIDFWLSQMVDFDCTRHSLWIAMYSNTYFLVYASLPQMVPQVFSHIYLCYWNSITLSFLHSYQKLKTFLIPNASMYWFIRIIKINNN